MLESNSVAAGLSREETVFIFRGRFKVKKLTLLWFQEHCEAIAGTCESVPFREKGSHEFEGGRPARQALDRISNRAVSCSSTDSRLLLRFPHKASSD